MERESAHAQRFGCWLSFCLAQRAENNQPRHKRRKVAPISVSRCTLVADKDTQWQGVQAFALTVTIGLRERAWPQGPVRRRIGLITCRYDDDRRCRGTLRKRGWATRTIDDSVQALYFPSSYKCRISLLPFLCQRQAASGRPATERCESGSTRCVDQRAVLGPAHGDRRRETLYLEPRVG